MTPDITAVSHATAIDVLLEACDGASAMVEYSIDGRLAGSYTRLKAAWDRIVAAQGEFTAGTATSQTVLELMSGSIDGALAANALADDVAELSKAFAGIAVRLACALAAERGVDPRDVIRPMLVAS